VNNDETMFSSLAFSSLNRHDIFSLFCEMPPLRFHWKNELISFCFSFYLIPEAFSN